MRRERLGFRDIPSKFKMICSSNPKLSIIYGFVIAILSTASITAISHWSNTATIPTNRESLLILYLTALFFPFILVKEFYFRLIQGHLNEANRLKEYFKMTGLGIFIDNILLVPIMVLLWGLHSLALTLSVLILFSIIQQVFVT